MSNLETKSHPFSLAYNLAVPPRGIIALYGAGGKTTLLGRLARELAGKGNKVCLTTTTKIFRPAEFPAVLESDFGAAADALREKFNHHNIVALGGSLLPNDKFDGIEPDWAKKLLALGVVSHVLIEADGAARKPIKGYASFEPVLPPEADLIIPIQGLDALGLTLEEKNIHRPELFAEAMGAPLGEPLSPFFFSRSLLQMIVRGREQSPRARIVPLINKVDLLTERVLLRTIASELASSSLVDRLLFTAFQEENPVKYVFDLSSATPALFVSCVLLAAGSSQRMGEDKLLLSLKGKTVLAHAVQNAAAAGVAEVIVVTRPESCGIVEETVAGAVGKAVAAKVKVIPNPWHYRGISSSLKAGIAAVDPLAQGIVFALGDQPFIPAEVYNLLLDHYIQNLNLLTYPQFAGKKGNPTLFDRRTWPELMALSGDTGGRQIISRLPAEEVRAVETRCQGVLADLDTPEDWEKYCTGPGYF